MAGLKESAKALADDLRETAVALEKGNFESLRATLIEVTQIMAVIIEKHAETAIGLNDLAQTMRDLVRRLGNKGML